VVTGVREIRERSTAKNAIWMKSGSGLHWTDALQLEDNWLVLPSQLAEVGNATVAS
jgi:hypothetical protein